MTFFNVLVNGNFALYRIQTASLETHWVNIGLPDGYGTGVIRSDGDKLWILDTFSSKLLSLLGGTQAVDTSGDAPQNVKSDFAVSDVSVFVMAEHAPTVLKLNTDGSVAREIPMPEIPRGRRRSFRPNLGFVAESDCGVGSKNRCDDQEL